MGGSATTVWRCVVGVMVAMVWSSVLAEDALPLPPRHSTPASSGPRRRLRKAGEAASLCVCRVGEAQERQRRTGGDTQRHTQEKVKCCLCCLSPADLTKPSPPSYTHLQPPNTIMDGYRRGREGPMDWEVTQDAASSRLAPTHNDDAMDITFQDESIRDVSMADDADDTQTVDVAPDTKSQPSASDTAIIEEIPRPGDKGSKASSSQDASSSALVSLFGSKSSRQRSKKSRRRRGSHSSVGSSVADDGDGQRAAGQWPLAPVVGTVINYLVPPVPALSAASAASSQQYTEAQLRRSDAAQKAHNTLHPREKPLLLLSYAQLAFNSSLLLLAGYVVFALVWTIRLDVVERLREIEDGESWWI